MSAFAAQSRLVLGQQKVAEKSNEITAIPQLLKLLSLQGVTGTIAAFVIAAMQATQVFSVRLAILMLAIPVFLLFSLVALVDGLVRRDLRRWGGGRESSFVYHYAKKAAIPFIVLTWVVYLSLPFSLHPTFVILPFPSPRCSRSPWQ